MQQFLLMGEFVHFCNDSTKPSTNSALQVGWAGGGVPILFVVVRYRGLQVGWHIFAMKIRACAHFWWDFELKFLRMRKFSLQILCQPTSKPR